MVAGRDNGQSSGIESARKRRHNRLAHKNGNCRMPLDTDDLAPPPKKDARPDLANLSVFELEARIAAHEAEIEEMRTLIAKKKAAQSAAASVFKS
jgi:uncharacterized small protein (DUF1192 family)